MTPGDYNLTDAELPAIRQFLSFQQTFGPGIRALVPGDWLSYCDAAASLDAVYPQIQNPVYKSWLDQFFALLVETPTNAVPGQQLALKHMYIVYAYGRASKAPPFVDYAPLNQYFPVNATTTAQMPCKTMAMTGTRVRSLTRPTALKNTPSRAIA